MSESPLVALGISTVQLTTSHLGKQFQEIAVFFYILQLAVREFGISTVKNTLLPLTYA